jgi:replicative DNA helicase
MSNRAEQLQNREAEEAVLGAILVNPIMLSEIRIILTAEDFFIRRNGAIFQAMCDLADDGSQIDLILVEDRATMDFGGAAYLTQLIGNVPISLHGPHYAEIVKKMSRRRALVKSAQDVAKSAYNLDLDVDDIAAEAQSSIIEATTYIGAGGPMPIEESLEIHHDYVSKTQSGDIVSVPTGLVDWDRLLAGGLKATTINLLGARTGMGKTAVACTVAKNVALDGGCPAFFSLEQPTSQIVTRLIAQDVGVSVEKFDIKDGLTTAELAEWDKAIGEFSQVKFYIDDTPGLNVMDIVNRARVLKRAHNINILIIDYLQLVRPSKPSRMRYLEIKDVLDHLHICSRELDIPIFTTVQLGREIDSRQDKRPVLKDLRESGDLEQYGYTISFFHRDAFYDPTTINQLGAELIVSKHRQGRTGTAQVIFRGEYSRVENAVLQTINLPGGGTVI